jgi:DnaJ family protein C protein 7
MNFFSKSPKKSKKTPTSDEEPHSPRSRSPLKKSSSSSSRSGRAKDENHRPGQGSARNSRSFPRAGPDSPRHPFDLNTHPLNLPPDQIRRLSALSSMSDPDRMDVESEGPNGAPASPSPQTSMPGSFDSPKINGTNGTPNGEGPVPPPHKSNPTSPAPVAAPTPEEAEAFKTAGNKFYKAKEYKKAIEEYTKGMDFGRKIKYISG